MPDNTYKSLKTTLRSMGIEIIQIHLYKQGSAQPESKATIPLATLQISLELLPADSKTALAKDGIDYEPEGWNPKKNAARNVETLLGESSKRPLQAGRMFLYPGSASFRLRTKGNGSAATLTKTNP